jgi:adenylosuccinate synthase
VLTHPDVYDDFEEISVCVAYSIDGTETRHFPSSSRRLDRAEPVLKTFPGWKESIKNVRSYQDLPENARAYIEFIEEFVDTPVDIISLGPDREQTFLRKKLW